jgi:hypothetical protein
VFWVFVVLGVVGACGQSKRADVAGGDGTGASGMSGAPGNEAGGSGGSSSNAACGAVTRNGRCTGNVYEWCDYFTGGIARLDCTPLGATCRASASQSRERESNGCVAAPCETGETTCEGALVEQCEEDGVLVNDCAKFGGTGSVCDPVGTSFWCTRRTCSNPGEATCAGDLRLICNEDGFLVIEDCARCDPAGTCVPSAPGTEVPVACDRPSWGCE